MLFRSEKEIAKFKKEINDSIEKLEDECRITLINKRTIDSDISLLAKELAKNSKILEQSLNECNTFKNNYKELSVEFAQKRNEIIKLKIECKYLSSEIEKYESIINSNKDNKPAPLDFEKKKEVNQTYD